jgi:uncharacterized membrane protein
MEIAGKRIPPYGLAALAFLVPLLFALYTGHAWEDYYITYRASHNLATGHGLVFTPGERVQSFTSPLGTLLPALCAWVTGGNHDDTALWLYRLICCAFLAGAAFLLAGLGNHWRLSAWGTTVLFGLFLTSAKIVDFTINGMESALMIFFLAWCLVGFFEPRRRTVWWLGLGFAGLMWTRPDGFVPGGALVTGWLVFGGKLPEGLSWKRRLRLLAGAALVAAPLYAPWFIWAWSYYGSPIPQTILAKRALIISESVLHKLGAHLLAIYTGEAWQAQLFSPSYDFLGGWPGFIPRLSEALALVAMFYFLWPKGRPEGRIASLALFLGGFYLENIPLCAWYLPVWEVIAFVTLAFVVEDAAASLAGFSNGFMLSGLRIAVTVLLIVFTGILLGSAREFKIQETYIERGGREQIGLWLHAHAAAGDTVFLEPLGYIGYYSGLKTYDIPGLSSPEVVAALKTGNHDYVTVILALHPTWLVLRPEDAYILVTETRLLNRDYRPVKSFSCYTQIHDIPFLPGRNLLLTDANFIIFHRQDIITKAPR